MSDVPTKTPVPRNVMMRSCRWERAKERGRRPAIKELHMVRGGTRGPRAEIWGTHAIAMMVVSVSSIKRPSHMFAVLL